MYGMEVSGTSSPSVWSLLLSGMDQCPAFVMVYNAGFMSSFKELQMRLEKLMAVIDSGEGKFRVPIVVVETQFSGSGSPLKVREVPEGLGKEYVEGKGCVFLGMALMTWGEAKRVFGTVVELWHEVCGIRGGELSLREKLDIFHKGSTILREK